MIRLRSRLRTGVFAAGGAVAGLTLAPPPASVVLAAGLALGGARLARAAGARAARAAAEAISRAAPESIDLLAVCALAGMGIDPALRMVAAAADPPMRAVLAAAVRMLDVGMPRDAAYAAMLDASGGSAEIRGLVRALQRSERYGAPLAAVLSAQAADARDRLRAAVRERALSAPVRMLFPLTLCFLPAFVLLAIAPSLIVAVRSLAGP